MRCTDLSPNVLLESPQTVASITRLAWAILNMAGTLGPNALVTAAKQYGGYYLEHMDSNDLHAVSLNQLPKSLIKGLEPAFKAFVDEMIHRHLRIAFAPNSNAAQGRNFRGWFTPKWGSRQPEIILVIKDEQFAFVKEALRNNYQLESRVRDILKPLTDILVHELTHAYDEWASNGQWQNNGRSQKALSAEQDRSINRSDPKKSEAAFELYLNDPIEINARYVQVVSQLEHKRSFMSWNEYRHAFAYGMHGWRSLPPKDKRRLLTRLATQWQEGRNTLDQDVQAACKRLQSRLQSTPAGADVWLSSNKDSGAINVNGIKLKKPELIMALLRPILVLADHYKMTVALGDKLPIPAVRPLGFINQRPRSPNGGKRDYSLPLGTVYFRRPVDRRKVAA